MMHTSCGAARDASCCGDWQDHLSHAMLLPDLLRRSGVSTSGRAHALTGPSSSSSARCLLLDGLQWQGLLAVSFTGVQPAQVCCCHSSARTSQTLLHLRLRQLYASGPTAKWTRHVQKHCGSYTAAGDTGKRWQTCTAAVLPRLSGQS